VSATTVPVPATATPDDQQRGNDPASAAAPPSRRSAILRASVIVGVLVLVFGVILPRFVDYQDVFNAFRDLTLQQFILMTILGVIAWLISGQVFTVLIQRLGIVHGGESYVILSGIGSSVPFGPWNMGVVWVIVRGWGIGNQPATSGIALYGVANQLGRLALPLLGGILLFASGETAKNTDGPFWIAVISIIAFLVATGVIFAVVRSDRIADWLGRTSQRVATWVLTKLGRGPGPDVSAAIHRFRDELGEVIRRRGALSLLVSVVAQVSWSIVLIVALRVVGISDKVLTPIDVFAVYALVSVITIIPISPGGAGVPEILFIAGLTTIAGSNYEAAITAGVFLYRLYNWFIPIPLAWILLKVARRGHPMLPTTSEIKTLAAGDAA
jgi:uncharacterized membrane protein YbhN (UPF0104 family)